MHPAFSLVLFTTLSGIGFGIMTWVGLGAGPQTPGFAWPAGLIAGVLVACGLGASTLHLKRPDRAWRAFTQWRSSWLSREAVLAVFACAAFGLFWLAWVGLGMRVAALGWLAAALSLATVFSTAMIYAQLRSVPKWATPLTPLTYMAFSVAGGAIVVACLAALAGGLPRWLPPVALVALVAAWAAKLAWWRRSNSAKARRPGAGEATGLGHLGQVRQFEPPHTGGNYLIREMAFTIARTRRRALMRVAVALGAVVPTGLLMLTIVVTGTGSVAAALCAAVLAHLAGMLAERWLFFAEAQHVMSSYYDTASG